MKTNFLRTGLFLLTLLMAIHSNSQGVTIYQLLPRTYGNHTTQNRHAGFYNQNGSGKLADITTEHLRELHDFGFSHVWFTGLLRHATTTDRSEYGIPADPECIVKGRCGSPYAIVDYYDICPDLAIRPRRRMQEFDSLVTRVHEAGLKFVMDFIPNHVARTYHSLCAPEGVADLGMNDDRTQAFSPRNNFYYLPGDTLDTSAFQIEGAEPYVEFPARATGNDRFDAHPTKNDWYETIKLNYGIDYQNGRAEHFDPIPDTWIKMSDILLFWADKGVDAFRCDMAEMVPTAFWRFATGKVHEQHPHVEFIAEIYNPDAYQPYIDAGFDYLYDKVQLYDTLRAVVRDETSAQAITKCWQEQEGLDKRHLLRFLENHDEQRIASPFFGGSPEAGRPAAVCAALMGVGPFMLFAGQELGEKGMDDEGYSGVDGRTSIFDYWSPATLQLLGETKRKPATWTKEQQELYTFYQRLMRVKRDNPAAVRGQFYDLQYAQSASEHYDLDRHYSFLRYDAESGKLLLVICNFAPTAAYDVPIHIPQHAFDFLGIKAGRYRATGLLTGMKHNVQISPTQPLQTTIPPQTAIVLELCTK